MESSQNALGFVRFVWGLVERGTTAKEILDACEGLGQKCKLCPKGEPYPSKLQWDDRVYTGPLAEVRRLGLMSSVASALASTGPEGSFEVQQAIGLLSLAREAQGWGCSKEVIPNEYRKKKLPPEARNSVSVSYDYWKLTSGRPDNRHPYATDVTDEIWPAEEELDMWSSLWLLLHSSGREPQGDMAYGQLLGFKDEVLSRHLAPAVAQNYCESLIAVDDPLRADSTALHETVRFCALYTALRLAYPKVSRYAAEQALGYPSREYVNHWSIGLTLSLMEQDWHG
jgi:hypothetical protein